MTAALVPTVYIFRQTRRRFSGTLVTMSSALKIVAIPLLLFGAFKFLQDEEAPLLETDSEFLKMVPKPLIGLLWLVLALVLLASFVFPGADHLLSWISHTGEAEESFEQRLGAWIALPFLLFCSGVSAVVGAAPALDRDGEGVLASVIGAPIFVGLLIWDATYLHLI